ncbi:hypothetical protein [Staphylococcus sp. HMSC057C08]|uniref:hypothetical protein n=1 Tax=Staphylococcus sp. HMSC057C08 TaxID=1739501 RepID=UPI0015D66A52|nr:hypothetical protein [Staphylococcus sp. HMSC057C08]
MLTVLTEDNDILFVGEDNFEQKVLEENKQYLEGYFAALVHEAQRKNNQNMK